MFGCKRNLIPLPDWAFSLFFLAMQFLDMTDCSLSFPFLSLPFSLLLSFIQSFSSFPSLLSPSPSLSSSSCPFSTPSSCLFSLEYESVFLFNNQNASKLHWHFNRSYISHFEQYQVLKKTGISFLLSTVEQLSEWLKSGGNYDNR